MQAKQSTSCAECFLCHSGLLSRYTFPFPTFYARQSPHTSEVYDENNSASTMHAKMTEDSALVFSRAYWRPCIASRCRDKRRHLLTTTSVKDARRRDTVQSRTWWKTILASNWNKPNGNGPKATFLPIANNASAKNYLHGNRYGPLFIYYDQIPKKKHTLQQYYNQT